jgi:hypothetical protein
MAQRKIDLSYLWARKQGGLTMGKGKIRIYLSILGVIGLLFPIGISTYAAGGYTFTTIKAPNSTHTYATDINNHGNIVGAYIDSQVWTTHGFLREHSGALTTLDINGQSTFLIGINDLGQIVGYRYNGYWSGLGYGFMRNPSGSVLDIHYPGSWSAWTFPYSINNNGQIVGNYHDNAHYHGFLLDANGNYSTIDPPGSTETVSNGINDIGQIVGTFRDYRRHGYLREPNGNFVTFDYPGSTETRAYGINNKSEIVGYYVDSSGTHGFLRSPSGVFTSTDYPGALTTVIHGINDSSEICGMYDADGITSGFLAIPNKRHNSTWLMLLLGN